jgi:ABC-type branched-subunit amino acid transport system permease subunit
MLALALAMILAYGFQNSRHGLLLRASRDDKVAARSSAVNIWRVRLEAFVLSAFIAGAGYARLLERQQHRQSRRRLSENKRLR